MITIFSQLFVFIIITIINVIILLLLLFLFVHFRCAIRTPREILLDNNWVYRIIGIRQLAARTQTATHILTAVRLYRFLQ